MHTDVLMQFDGGLRIHYQEDTFGNRFLMLFRMGNNVISLVDNEIDELVKEVEDGRTKSSGL